MLKLKFGQTIVSAIATVAVLYSTNASAFVFHAAGAECELYESGNGFTINGILASSKTPTSGTVSLSCPVIETDSFVKSAVTGVYVDGNVSTQAGSAIKAQACSNPIFGGSLHCGAQQTSTTTGRTTVFLGAADIGSAWGSQVDVLEYPYVAVSLLGVGTFITGYELD